jgi:hypothetical protein
VGSPAYWAVAGPLVLAQETDGIGSDHSKKGFSFASVSRKTEPFREDFAKTQYEDWPRPGHDARAGREAAKKGRASAAKAVVRPYLTSAHIRNLRVTRMLFDTDKER